MIPSDLAARLRLLTEASLFDSEPPLTGLTRGRELQARLPELAPGERFVATIDRQLPDGTFRAIVAGRDYTLALNQSAKSGDTLELIVTDSTPKAVFAQLAEPLLAANEGARPALSATGRLIGFLLTGQPAPQAATLAGGKPIIAAPPANDAAATLAPALRQTLSQSGLFYESHQLQWISGKLDTASLLQEPQGELARAPGTPTDAATIARHVPPMRTTGEFATTAAPQDAMSATQDADAAASPNLPAAAGARAAAVPERLAPVVYQQLDAMATQNYVWQGQVWPGQTMEWEIEDPQRDDGSGADEPAAEWKTTLRLALPRLGGVEARLILTPTGVALRLMADDNATVAALVNARAALDSALEAANVPLTGFVAERRDGGT